MLQELRTKRGALVKEMRDILAAAEAESRAMTSEETEKYERMEADLDALGKTIEREERLVSVEAELRHSTPRAGDRVGGEPVAEPGITAEQRNAAFDAYLRHGDRDMPAEQRAILSEMRAQSVGTTTAGGYTVPEGFSGQLEESLKLFGGMRQAARVMPTDKGNDIPWPTVDETAVTGRLLAENTQVTGTDITFGVVTLKAYKYSSDLVLVSQELLQDSGVDVTGYIAKALGERIGRITNTHFTTGDNSSKPQGVVTAASLGKTGASGQTTSVIYDDLVDLLHSVDPAYRMSPSCAFMMNDSSVKVIRKLKDSQGIPLWQPGLVAGEPDTILGKRVLINQDIAAMAASAKSILFGDFSKYIIRDVRGISVLRLNERYADYHQVGFLAFSRHDGRLLDAGTDPIKYYANAAS